MNVEVGLHGPQEVLFGIYFLPTRVVKGGPKVKLWSLFVHCSLSRRAVISGQYIFATIYKKN